MNTKLLLCVRLTSTQKVANALRNIVTRKVGLSWHMRWRTAVPSPVFAILLAFMWTNALAQMYGVVEIGSKGVRGFVFDCGSTGVGGTVKSYLGCSLPSKQPGPLNVTPLDPDALEDTLQAVAKLLQQVEDYGVTPENIYVVGSSGVSQAPHKDKLIERITSQIKPVNQVSFVKVEEEVRYAFDGVIAMLPGKYQDARRRAAVVIDIGSGNTKGSYLEINGDAERFVSFSIPFGTKTATKAIDETKGESNFVSAAKQWYGDKLLPLLSDELDRVPGMINRGRVYLIGGIPWALFTLTKANNAEELNFPRIMVRDIDSLYKKATSEDAESVLCIENKQKTAGSDVEKVCNTFTTNNLIAGLQILQGLAKEMRLNNRNKHIFFFRNSQFAWPLGYLKNRVN